MTVLGGLPFPITIAAHGTAFDVADTGATNLEPIRRAVHIAVQIAGRLNGAA